MWLKKIYIKNVEIYSSTEFIIESVWSGEGEGLCVRCLYNYLHMMHSVMIVSQVILLL